MTDNGYELHLFLKFKTKNDFKKKNPSKTIVSSKRILLLRINLYILAKYIMLRYTIILPIFFFFHINDNFVKPNCIKKNITTFKY